MTSRFIITGFSSGLLIAVIKVIATSILPESNSLPSARAMLRSRSNDWFKGTYLAAKYRRISACRGPMKAIVAVEHSTLIAVRHMLPTGEGYEDSGADHFTRLDPIKAKNNAIQKLHSLGYEVTISPATAA